MGLAIAAAQSASVPGGVPENVAHHLLFCEAAAAQGAQLLIFPELSLTGYELGLARAHMLRPDSAELDPLRRMAAEVGMIVSVGAPVANERGELYIAALILQPDGSVSIYAKEHVHQSEEHVFTSGPGGAALRVAEVNVALAICADASHPAHAAKAVRRGADVYAVGAMIDSEAYPRKSALLQNYAREHRMAVLLANYSGSTGGYESAGRSALWTADGVVATAPAIGECLVIASRRNSAWSGQVVPVENL